MSRIKIFQSVKQHIQEENGNFAINQGGKWLCLIPVQYEQMTPGLVSKGDIKV